jgi:hypothetical protein
MKELLKELGFEQLPALGELVYKIGQSTKLDNNCSEDDIYEYNHFIRQPFNKGQFIPCDLEGNVLSEPKGYSPWICDNRNKYHHSHELCVEFQQAEERVIFKGWEMTVNVHGEFLMEQYGQGVDSMIHKTIEQFINSGGKLELK